MPEVVVVPLLILGVFALAVFAAKLRGH